jgi:redox-sensitive bicupin YhaK (pirin superfamily)
MMKQMIHKSDERGQANHGWLQAKHSFSFARYYDANKLQFGALRVLNDDIIAPSMGFGTHPHDNMEIITIPLSGFLKHRDTMHNDWQEIQPGEVQIMSAGTGLQHSEINGSLKEELKLFQIWITPNESNVKPRYDQKYFHSKDRQGRLQTLVSGFNSKDTNSLKIHQDARISRIDLNENDRFTYQLINENNGVYVMLISGEAAINDSILYHRDAMGISETDEFEIISNSKTEVLFIEVPMF